MIVCSNLGYLAGKLRKVTNIGEQQRPELDLRIEWFFDCCHVKAGKKLDKIVGMSVLELYPEISDYLKRKIDTVFVIESPSFSYWEQRPHVFPFKSSRPVSGSSRPVQCAVSWKKAPASGSFCRLLLPRVQTSAQW